MRQRVSIVKTDSLLNAVVLNARHTFIEGLSGAVMTQFRERLNRHQPRPFLRLREHREAADRGRRGPAHRRWDYRGKTSDAQRRRGGSRADAESLGGRWRGLLSNATGTRHAPGLVADGSAELAIGADRDGGREMGPRRLQESQDSSRDGFRSYARTSPRVGVNWEAGGGASLRASYAEAFRAPTSGELSALGPFVSTPDLRPVKTKSWETGASWRHPAWGEIDLTVYRAVADDEIYAIFDPVAGFGQNKNIERTRRQGVEVSLRPRIGKADAWLDYSYTEATFQKRFLLDNATFTGTQTVTPGAEIPMVPRQRLSVGASVPLPRGFRAGAGGQCVGSSRFFGDEANQEQKLPGYCTLDLDASVEHGAWTISLAARNALDEGYATRGILASSGGRLERFVVPAVGRTVSARLRWRFAGK